MDVRNSNERRHRHRKTGGRKRSSQPDKENTESQWVSTMTSSQSEGKSDSSNSAGDGSMEIPKSEEDLTCQRWETRPTPPIELCTPSHSASVIPNSVQTPVSEPPDRLSQETPVLDTQSTPTVSKTEAATERKVNRERKKIEGSHQSSDIGGNSPHSHSNPSSSADELSTSVTESEVCDIYKDCYYNPIHLPLSSELYTPAYCVHVTDTCDVDKGVEQSLAVAYQTGTHVENEDVPITQAEEENQGKSVHVGDDTVQKGIIDLKHHEVEQSQDMEKQVADSLDVPKEQLSKGPFSIPQNKAPISETLESIESSPVEVSVQDDAHEKSLREIEAIPESLEKNDLTTKLDSTDEDKGVHKKKKKFGWPKRNLEFGKGNYDPANALRNYDDNSEKEIQLVSVHKLEESDEKEKAEPDEKESEIENEMPSETKKRAKINDLAVVSVKAPKFGIRFDRKKRKINDNQSENEARLSKDQGDHTPREGPENKPKTFRFTMGEKLGIGPHKTTNTGDMSTIQMPHVTDEETHVLSSIEEPQIKEPERKELTVGSGKNRPQKEYNVFASDEIQDTLTGNRTETPNVTTQRTMSTEENVEKECTEHNTPREKRTQEKATLRNIREAFQIKEILTQINEKNEETANGEAEITKRNNKQTTQNTSKYPEKKGQHQRRKTESANTPAEQGNGAKNRIHLPTVKVSVPSKKFGFGFGFGREGEKGSLKVKKPKVSGEAGVDMSAGANVHAPELGADARLPGFGGSLDVDVGLPKVQVDASAPSVHVRGPELQIPEVGVDVGLGGAGHVDGGGQTGAAGVSLKAPKFGFKFGKKDKKAKVAVPSVGTPDVGVSGDVQLPSAEVSVPSKKFGFGFGFGGKGKKGSLKVKKPKVSGEAGVDMSAGANVSAPDVDVDLHAGGDAKSGGLKFPKISMPTFKLGASHPHADVDVSLPDASVSVSGPTVDLPSLKAEMDVPDVDLRLPDVSATGDLSAQMGLGGVPSAEFGADLKLPDVAESGDVSAPAVGFNMRPPELGSPVGVALSPSAAPFKSGVCSDSVCAAGVPAIFHSSGIPVASSTNLVGDSSFSGGTPGSLNVVVDDSLSSPSRPSAGVPALDVEIFDSTNSNLRPLNFTFDHGGHVDSVGGTLELSTKSLTSSRDPQPSFSLSRLFGSLHRRKRKRPKRHQDVAAPKDVVNSEAIVRKASEDLLAGRISNHANGTNGEAAKTHPYTSSTPTQRSSLPKSRDSLIRQTWHGDDDRLNLSPDAGHLFDSGEAPQLPPTPTGVRIKPVLKDPGNLLEVRRRGTIDSSKPRPWSTLECPPLGCVFVNDDYLFPDALTPTKIPSFRGSKDAVYNVPYMDDKAIPSDEPEWPVGESRRTLLSQLSQNSGSLARIAAEESSIISL
ncbi:uncharacterized protein DEA37_0002914, partial [Paragonimus westermani]